MVHVLFQFTMLTNMLNTNKLNRNGDTYFDAQKSTINYELTIVLNDNRQASGGQEHKRFQKIKIYGTPTSFSKFMGCKVEARRCMTATVRVNITYLGDMLNQWTAREKDEKHRGEERIVKLQKVLETGHST